MFDHIRYRVVRPLGSGAAGSVYLVEDRALPGPLLALKRVEAGHALAFRESLTREFAVLASLALPCVARVYDLGYVAAGGELPEGTYFTRSFVDGVPLSEYATSHAFVERIAVFASTLRTVSLLHRAGVVHGDLKPGNIIVDSEGDAHLIDFGLSTRGADAASLSGSGTPLYMAPELLRGGQPSIAGDVYALGATLWTLVLGRAPHEELGAKALSAKLASVAPRLPQAEFDPLSTALLDLARAALVADPNTRTPSADELLAGLEKRMGDALKPVNAARPALFVAPRTRGREPVLGELVRWAEAVSGDNLLVLAGTSGLGKSTVLRELKWRLQLHRTRVIEVRCAAQGPPLAQLVRQIAAFERGGLHTRLLQQVESRALDRAELVQRVSDALVACAREGPLVVIVDDLDETESVLAELLRVSVHGDEPVAMRVIASASQGTAHSIQALGSTRALHLAALSPDDMATLADELLGPMDALAKHALLARAQGNPGVLVEAAAVLMERPGFSVADVEALRVGGIGDRLARTRASALTPRERLVLEVLSLCGRPLPERLVRGVLNQADDACFQSLERAGLVVRTWGTVCTEDLAFSAWLRNELGASASRELAQRLLAASGSEALDAVTRVELALCAQDAELLAAESEQAARALQKHGALAAATRVLEASLTIVPEEHATRFRMLLAELYGECGEANQALFHAQAVLARDQLDPVERARASLCAATSLVTVGKLDSALALLVNLPSDATGSAHRQGARVLARLLLRRGQHERARSVAAQGAANAALEDPAVPELLAIEAYGLALSGQPEQASALYGRALASAERLGLRRESAQVLGYRALGYEREGRLELARAEYERGLEAAREAGDLGLTATYALNHGNVSYRVGQLDSAAQSFELAARLSRRAGRTSTALLAANNLADVHVYLGSYARAEQLAATTLTAARELTIEVAEAQATHVLANVAGRTGRFERALSEYERAAALYRKLERPREAAEALLDAAELLLETRGASNVSLASARLATARELIEQHGVDDLRLRLKLLVSVARAGSGDASAALRELEGLEGQLHEASHRDLRWQLLSAQADVYRELGLLLLAGKKAREAAELLEGIAARVSQDARAAFRADPRRRRVFELARTMLVEANPGSERVLAPERELPLVRLLELLKRLAREREEGRLLERITDAAVELSGAERGFVLLPNERGELLPHTVRQGRGVEQDPHIAFSRSIAEAVLIDGEPIITVNARDDARVNDYMSVHKLSLKSVACIPINGPRGVLGVLYLEHRLRAGRFRDSDLDVLLAFADQAAIALENAALWAENQRSQRELEEKNLELSAAKKDIERLLEARTEELAEARQALQRARLELETRYQRHGIIGQSAEMRRVFAMIERVADSKLPVVVQGESGTGKELVARAVHAESPRSKGPFVAVNCAALPDSLLESELFGHVRGAFTGADRDRKGLFAQADGGTLFLDEFAAMSPRMQIDLLRVLQEGTVRPVGAELELPVDVRVTVASQRPLEHLVREGVLREDLYYRLSVIEIKLPALRDRREDIPLLCQHFLARLAQPSRATPRVLSSAALRCIMASSLPGNVRQLEHLLTSAAMMAEGHAIELTDLPAELRGGHDDRSAAPEPSGAPEPLPRDEPAPGDWQAFKEREKQRILAALEKHAWNRAKAASALGMPRRTFYRRLSEFGIL